jgi:amidophosphoribosyltransferase
MAKFIGVDLLAFVSIDGLYRAMACRPGATPTRRPSATPASPATYPIPLDDQLGVEDRQLSFLAEPA